ncbi:MAG: DUF1553 domain-containing protein [Planctomycetales bacterium]|nr:DUF1553 domain-containing protein [Planctomycetales bacterium]
MVLACLACLASLAASPALAVDYLRDVKPLLEHKCYACHGALRQQGGLRTDTVKSLIQGGDSGAAVVAGAPANSLLLDVLTGEAGFRMPPEKEGAALSPAEIGIIREWIASGAPAPERDEPQVGPAQWWSYQPLLRPPVPAADPAWCRQPLDCFIDAERQRRGLSHTSEAPRSVWLRRVYLDLIGLPPTRDRLHAFLADQREDAYERVVDELLASPRYGERWGRHWMDIWRYSDWYGSRGGNEIRYSQRHIWRWRDWIIRSLNRDLGYDDMVRHMLSADERELPEHDDIGQLAATGYLGRNWYKFDRDVWLFDSVERTSEALLGVTMRCCRCHNHKFDPITQQEYYRFRAFFEPHDVRTDPLAAGGPTEKDPTLGQVLTDGMPLVYDKHLDRPTYLLQRGDSRYPDESTPLAPGVPQALAKTVALPDINPVELPAEIWFPTLRPEMRSSLAQQARQRVADASADCDSKQQKLEELQEALKLAESRLAEGKQSGDQTPEPFLKDRFDQPESKQWRVVNGDWNRKDGKLVQSTVTSFATIVTQDNHPADFRARLRYRTLSPGTYRSVGFSFDYRDQGNSQDVYTSTGDSSQSVQAFHRADGKQVYPPAGIVRTDLKVGADTVLEVEVVGARLTITLNGKRELDYALPVPRREGKFALWVHQGAAEFLELTIEALAESTETMQQRITAAQRDVDLAVAHRNWAEAEAESVQRRLDADVAAYLTSDPESPLLAKAAATAERQANLRQAELEHMRAAQGGNAEAVQKAAQLLEAAQKRASDMFAEYAASGVQHPRTSTGRRRALAEWIASPDNVRTARVAANHLWGRHFGRPLVATPENFGLNGRRPTHPELLDWLASELIRNDWRMQPLHRQIVLSATYRMSTSPPDQPNAAALASSDGEAPQAADDYYPQLPVRRMEAEVVRDSVLHLAGELKLTMYGKEIPENQGESTKRRSLYFRSTPNEKMAMLEVFDIADPNGCYRRKESVVPHQSLAMLNSGLTQDSARRLAELLGAEHTENAEFVRAAFETILTRSATDEEHRRCLQFLDSHPELLAANSSGGFAPGGTATRKPAADPRQRARENLVHVLLLHNDFVTIR